MYEGLAFPTPVTTQSSRDFQQGLSPHDINFLEYFWRGVPHWRSSVDDDFGFHFAENMEKGFGVADIAVVIRGASEPVSSASEVEDVDFGVFVDRIPGTESRKAQRRSVNG
jgi:hypothetical protein